MVEVRAATWAIVLVLALAGGAAPNPAGGSSAAGHAASAPIFRCGELPGACGECIAEKCCELAELCSADADCACMAMCIAAQSLAGVDGCLGSCGVDGSPPGFAALATCVAPTCPDGDECSAPAGFAPPPELEPSCQSSSTELGSGTLADCSFDDSLAYDPDGAILQLESVDGSICARIERRDDGMGSMANIQFTLISILVGPLGEVVQLDDPADVCWYSSHHNFNDWAHAWSGSRHYDLKMARADHGVAPTYSLQVFEQGPLEGASCPALAEGSCQIGDTIELFPVMP
jgi:hypothetical protein